MTATSLSITDWAQAKPLEVCAAEPPFYPGWTLIEARCRLDESEEREAIVAFLSSRQAGPVLLSGTSQPIHSLNGLSFLKLDNDTVLEYLRFFCVYVWGEEGPFRIVESKTSLAGSELSHDVEIAPAQIVEHDKEKGWICKAFVSYGRFLFSATLRVAPSGGVAMINDEPVSEIKGLARITYVAPIRILPAVPKREVTIPETVSAATDSASDALERTQTSSEPVPGAASSPFWLTSIGLRVIDPPEREGVFHTLRKLFEEFVRESKSRAEPGRAELSLRGLKASAFNYDSSRSLGQGVLLHLEGFEYDRIEDMKDRASRDFKTASLDSTAAPGLVGWFAALRLRGWSMGEGEKRARPHIALLSRQHGGLEPQSPNEFFPQPYEQLARVLRNHGAYLEARHLTLKKLSLERRLIHAWWARPFLGIMEIGFSHGLFPLRSVLWFLGLWLAGALVFDFANHGRVGFPPIGWERYYSPLSWPVLEPVLVVDALSVSSFVPPKSEASGRPPVGPAMQLARSREDVSEEVPCGSQIEPALYALDVFVPLLDLKQEEKCTISSREDAWPWRFFKSLYAVIGAFVTSMALLTISGVLRKRAEQ